MDRDEDAGRRSGRHLALDRGFERVRSDGRGPGRIRPPTHLGAGCLRRPHPESMSHLPGEVHVQLGRRHQDTAGDRAGGPIQRRLRWRQVYPAAWHRTETGCPGQPLEFPRGVPELHRPRVARRQPRRRSVRQRSGIGGALVRHPPLGTARRELPHVPLSVSTGNARGRARRPQPVDVFDRDGHGREHPRGLQHERQDRWKRESQLQIHRPRQGRSTRNDDRPRDDGRDRDGEQHQRTLGRLPQHELGSGRRLRLLVRQPVLSDGRPVVHADRLGRVPPEPAPGSAP